METVWKLQDAKSQFSKVVQNALKSGPQYVTRRGTKAAVVLSVRDYEKLILPLATYPSLIHGDYRIEFRPSFSSPQGLQAGLRLADPAPRRS